MTWIPWYAGNSRKSLVASEERTGSEVGRPAAMRRFAGILLASVVSVLVVAAVMTVSPNEQATLRPAVSQRAARLQPPKVSLVQASAAEATSRKAGGSAAARPSRPAVATHAPAKKAKTRIQHRATTVRRPAQLAAAPVTTAPVPVPVTTVPAPTVPVTAAPVTAAPVTTVPVTAAPVPVTAASTFASDCAVALAYLAAHAKPGFAHYCRPGPLNIGIPNAVSFTCMPGASVGCPDGGPEIVIARPSCAISYMDEASNSYWDFNSGGVITPGSVQNGRTWDPYGECP